MLRIALLLLSLVLLAHGADGTYRAVRSRTQTQMTCADFARDRPSSAWVRLTDCEVDYMHAGYRESPADIWGRLFGKEPAPARISELLFPVRAVGSSPDGPAALVVSTRDPGVVAIAERTLGTRSAIDQESFLVMMLQVVTAMRASRQIDGALRPPLETLRSRGALSAIRTPLDGNFAVLDLHERPRVLLPAIELATGLLALALVFVRRRRAPVETPVASAVASAFRRKETAPDYPRLMLLNLPAGATLADLEKAPQLGSHSHVRQRIESALPGLVFGDDGKGRYVAGECSMEVDLGRGDPVYTAVVDLHGDATAALDQLLAATGWRAFAPKRGAFVTPADFR
jgi:hypothetical protein